MDQGATPIEGDAIRVLVEAVGEPGRRRFRLVSLIDRTTCIVWMEKQQLQALGIALDQVLDQLEPAEGLAVSSAFPGDYDYQTRQQFRAGRMELGYDERLDRLVIVAHDLESAFDGPGLVCRITRDQARELSEQAAVVVAAGRAICPLCMMPMGPGPHVCPGQNGHLPTHFDEDDLETES